MSYPAKSTLCNPSWFSDASGLVLQTFGDTHAMQKAQRFALAPGNLWSESGRGTNAIGTALAIDDSCEIDGRQHFLTSNGVFIAPPCRCKVPMAK